MIEEKSTLRSVLMDELQPRLCNELKQEGNPGMPTGFRCLDAHYSLKHAGVTDWTGFPSSGKTYFVLELLVAQSVKFGTRHGIFVPDLGSEIETMKKLIKMRTGGDFISKYNNKISEQDMLKALPWIMHHFVIFKRKDFKEGVTPLDFWEKICNYSDSAGGLQTGLVDSWKNFKHLFKSREDSYLDEMLSIRNEMAEDNNKHFHTIAHAVKTELAEGMKKGSGRRRIPTEWDIKGGGAWSANGKSIITIDRPNKKYSTGVDVYILKTKPEDVGKEGEITGIMSLDQVKGRYYEMIDGIQCYAYDHLTMPQQMKADFSQEREYHNAKTSDSEFNFTSSKPDIDDDAPF